MCKHSPPLQTKKAHKTHLPLFKYINTRHGILALCIILGIGYTPICLGTNAAAPRDALVIANSDYRFGNLVHVQNNANRMTHSLTEAGFEVTAVKNVSEPEFSDLLESFAQRLADTHGVAVIYFAGQAIQIEGETYLLPLSMDARRKHDIKYSATSITQILDILRDAGTTLNLIILDVSTNKSLGPELKPERGGLAGLSTSQIPANTVVALPNKPDSPLAANDYYGKAWSRYILEPGMSIERIFNKVRADVEMNTDGRQSPQQFGSLEEDFTFVGLSPAASPIEEERMKPGTDDSQSENEALLTRAVYGHLGSKDMEIDGNLTRFSTDNITVTEQLFWDSVKDSTDVELISIYLDQFPHGEHLEEAHLLIARLNQMTTHAGENPHRQSIRELLRQAKAAYASNRLLTPANDSVLRWCEAVLDREPGNRGAEELLRNSIDRYLSWSASQLQRGALDKARSNIVKARSIQRYASQDQLSKLRHQENLLSDKHDHRVKPGVGKFFQTLFCRIAYGDKCKESLTD